MNSERREIVSDVFCDILEKLAFMFGEEVGTEEMPEPSEGITLSSMSFSGEMVGTLEMAVPTEMSVEVAVNVLGIDADEIDAEAANDSLKEVLNVICGNILTAIAGEEPIFDLSVPGVKDISSSDWRELMNDPDSINFLLDDNPVILRLQIEGEN